MAILTLENLSFSYPDRDEKALENICLTIGRGEFVVLCGESGCGKSTLLRLLKKQLRPKGTKSGGIFYKGVEIDDLDDRTAVTDIGFVMQNPDNQIVTDKVWHELAFGLESSVRSRTKFAAALRKSAAFSESATGTESVPANCRAVRSSC